MYEAHKRSRNVFVSHCYGAIHTLHLVKWLRDEGRAGEIVGVALLSLGARAPVSLGVAAWIPAFILGGQTYSMHNIIWRSILMLI